MCHEETLSATNLKPVSLQYYKDSRGTLVVAQSREQVPFQIERVFVLSDLTPGSERGGHAHRRCQEFLMVASGAVTVELDNVREQWRYRVSGPSQGVYIEPLTWIVLRDFDVGTICVVLASEPYNPTDYIRDYAEFCASATGANR